MSNINIDEIYDGIIIGGGPAGLSAAIYLARAKYRVLVIEKETIGGQITITSEVVNYPGVPQTNGTELTENMRKQAEYFGAEFAVAAVKEIQLEETVKTIVTEKGTYRALGIVLATGASPRKIGFQGETQFQGRGVAYCATCDGEFFAGMDVFVLGGGFAAAEEAMFLTKYAKKVRIMVRGDSFSCAGSIVDEVMSHPGIEVRFNTQIVEAGGKGKLEYAIFRDRKDDSTWEYKPESGEGFGIFVFAGYEPATALFKDLVELNESGYLITDINQKTSIDGVYGAGDVCVKNLRQVVTAVSDGAVAATSLEKYLAAQYEKLHLPKRKETMPKRQILEKKASEAAAQEEDRFITSQMRQQLEPVFARFERDILLEFYVDEQNISGEVRGFASEMEGLSPHILCRIKEKSASEKSDIEYPAIRICGTEGTYRGTSFHGVPGGHEFNSFVIALYNAAGPGQAIDKALLDRIRGISEEIRIQIVVSLSCTMCPELVMAAQRIALENSHIQADIYDMAHFPQLKKDYQIMSVPCMIINKKDVYFGKKGIEEILDILICAH